MNREGKNGYLTLESKRRLKAEAQVRTSMLWHWLFLMLFPSNYPKALKEEAAGEGSASPGKTDDKKRGHIKDDPDVEGTTEGEPPAKKTKAKAKAKKEPKIKNEDTDGGPEKDGPTIKETKTRIKKEPEFKKEDADGGPENDGPTIKETKSRIKKESKIKKEDADGGPENDGPTIKETKPRIKKEPKIKNEDADTRFGNDGSANKKTKAAFKKGKKANDAESDGDFEQNAQPVKKGHKRAKRAAAGEISALHSKDESSGHDVPSPPPAKKRRALRKAATAAIIKDEDTETDGLDSASEFETPLGNVKPEHKSELEAEASEGTPKLHKGRKGAPKKAVNETAGETNKEVKPKVRVLFAHWMVDKLTI